MIKKKICQILSVLIISSITLGFPMQGKAATITDIYDSNINVGLTTLGYISDFKFTVNGNYTIGNSSYVLTSGKSYEITISSGTLYLSENGNRILSVNQDVVITPGDNSYLISSSTNGKSYCGSMKFKIENSGGFLVINSLGIESYLMGVVPSEMPDSWGGSGGAQEALKAQAIAARTYALYSKEHNSTSDYDVRDDTGSQVYNGVQNAQNSNNAVQATKGQVLTYNGDFIDAVFSASDGGWTEASQNVWSNALPYLVEKQDTFDAQSSLYAYYDTQTHYTDSDIENLIRTKYPSWNLKQFVKIDTSNITKFTSGRISDLPVVYIDNNNVTQTGHVSKDNVRWFLNLRSNLFNISYQLDGGVASFSKYIGDSDRFGTAISIANTAFNPSASNKLQNVVIATGQDFPDALSGAVLAKKYNAPILLVDGNAGSTASSKVINYINSNLDKTNGKVFILGGTGVVPTAFESKFNQLGIPSSHIVRLGGSERLATSSLINNAIAAPTNTPIVVATANDFPDALSISPIAAANGWPIFIVNNAMSSYLQSFLSQDKPSMVYVVGGTGVVSETVRGQIKGILGYGDDKVVRLGGSTRYDTSRIINSYFINSSGKVILATGKDFPDALSGSVYAAMNNYPIILADSYDYQNAASYIKSVGNNGNIIQLESLGLSGAVSQSTVNSLSTLQRYDYKIDTKGYGHGLGLSQYGAYYRAKNAQSFSDILNFYYNNVTIQTLN